MLHARLRSETRDLRLRPLPGLPEILARLHLDPHLGARAERRFQAQCHFRADTGPAVEHSGQCLPGHAQSLGRFRDPQPVRQIVPEHFAWVRAKI